MMSTQTQANFSSMIPSSEPRAIENSTIVSITDLDDPQTSYLHPEFPVEMKGTKSGYEYFSRIQYLMYSSATAMGFDAKAKKILEFTKEYLEKKSPSYPFDIAASKEVTEKMFPVLDLGAEEFQIFQKEKFIGIMGRACVYSFSQNPHYLQMLLSTGSLPILYLSKNNYWGIGSEDPNQILGHNWYGRILTHVRFIFANSEFSGIEWAIPADPSTKKESFPREEIVETVVEEVKEEIVEAVVEEVKEEVPQAIVEAVVEEVKEEVVEEVKEEVVEPAMDSIAEILQIEKPTSGAVEIDV